MPVLSGEAHATETPANQLDDRAFEEAKKWVFEEHADLMNKLSQ